MSLLSTTSYGHGAMVAEGLPEKIFLYFQLEKYSFYNESALFYSATLA